MLFWFSVVFLFMSMAQWFWTHDNLWTLIWAICSMGCSVLNHVHKRVDDGR